MSAAPRLGVAYYPEQWPRDRWATDAALMAEAGLSVVRLGEFAWARMEPSEGSFDFTWLDEAIDLLAAHGLEIVLGTPTAAPPAWLVERHPEILPVHADGRRHPFGHRRHYCPNQPAMHAAARRIVAALADRYGDDARVIAWQIDNELGGRCVCEACRAAFHDWLPERYGSIESLNESWGTVFWSQTYDDFGQIPLPELGPVPPAGFLRHSPNPSLALDFRRFVSDSYVAFLRLQVDELRPRVRPEQRITHNLMGFRFGEIDYEKLAQSLDVVSWDNYPSLDRTGRWTSAALSADAMRGLRRAPVWVLEQQVGPLAWEVLHTPRRGQMRLHTYQAVVHGAELVCYFRWRTARHGTEQHWYGVLDAHGRPGRRYRELAELVRELGGLADALAGATPVADAALLHDYDSRWALQIQPTNAELAYEETIQRHYEALRSRSVGVDVVGPSSDLSSYRLVAAPNLYVVDDAIAAGLHRFVEAGGTLVLAPRAGAKDGCNVTPDVPLPAALAKLAGLEVVDLVSVADGASVHFTGVDGLDRGVYRGWYEQVEPTSAHALALYEDGEFPETPAVTANPVGAGRVLYLAGAADLETLAGIYAAVARGLGLATAALPEGVERVELQRNGETLVVLLNHGDREQAVTLDEPRQDLLANGGRRRRVRLAPFGVAVLVPLRAALEKV